LARATDMGVRRALTKAKGRPTMSSSGAPCVQSAAVRSVERGEDSGTILGDGDRVLRMRTIRTVGQTQGPAVLVDGELLRRERPPRFDRQGQSGLEDEPATALAAVGHVRILVHRVAEAVPAEVEVDGDAVGIGDVTDGLRDIAEAVPGLGGTDSGFEAGPRGVDEALVLFAAVADDGGACGVGDPAVDG